jgi:hypothetical protein
MYQNIILNPTNIYSYISIKTKLHSNTQASHPMEHKAHGKTVVMGFSEVVEKTKHGPFLRTEGKIGIGPVETKK